MTWQVCKTCEGVEVVADPKTPKNAVQKTTNYHEATDQRQFRITIHKQCRQTEAAENGLEAMEKVEKTEESVTFYVDLAEIAPICADFQKFEGHNYLEIATNSTSSKIVAPSELVAVNAFESDQVSYAFMFPFKPKHFHAFLESACPSLDGIRPAPVTMTNIIPILDMLVHFRSESLLTDCERVLMSTDLAALSSPVLNCLLRKGLFVSLDPRIVGRILCVCLMKDSKMADSYQDLIKPIGALFAESFAISYKSDEDKWKLRKNIEKLKEQIEELEQENDMLCDENDRLNKEIEEKDEELSEMKSGKAALEKHIDKLYDTIDEYNLLVDDMEVKIEAMEEMIESLNEEIIQQSIIIRGVEEEFEEESQKPEIDTNALLQDLQQRKKELEEDNTLEEMTKIANELIAVTLDNGVKQRAKAELEQITERFMQHVEAIEKNIQNIKNNPSVTFLQFIPQLPGFSESFCNDYDETMKEVEKRDKECLICMEAVAASKKTRKNCTKCKKRFHKVCWNEWKKTNPVCPHCRGAMQ